MIKINKQIFCILIILLFIFIQIHVCFAVTITLDKHEYNPQETSTAEMYITSSSEKNRIYTVEWNLPNGTLIDNCTETGTTPNGVGQPFYESCSLPEGLSGVNLSYANVTLSTGSFALDYFNITTAAPAGTLSIQQIVVRNSDIYLGEWQAVKGHVVDEGGVYSMGVRCDTEVRESDGTPVDVIANLESDSEGEIYGSWYVDPELYDVKGYTIKLSCWCSDSPSYTCQTYGAATGGYGLTSFTVHDVVTTHYSNESDPYLDIDGTNKYAGFDDIIVYHNRTNEYGDVLQTVTTYWLANIKTEQDFHYEQFKEIDGTLNIGTNEISQKLRLPPDLTDGTYRVEYETYYYHEKKLKKTEKYFSKPFNVTSVDHSSTYNSFSIKDYNKDNVNFSITPFSIKPDNFIVAGDNIYFCLNQTNLMDQSYDCNMVKLTFINNQLKDEISIVENRESLFPEFGTKRIISPGTYEYCDYFKFPYVESSSGYWKVQAKLAKSFGSNLFLDQAITMATYYFYVQLPVIIKNVSTDKFGTSVNACDDIILNVSYDFFGRNEKKYQVKYCFQDTDHDVILKCETKEIDFDYGEDHNFILHTTVPYIYNSANAEVDITIFDSDGDQVAFGDTEPANTFYINSNQNSECLYSLEERNTIAFEGLLDKLTELNLISQANAPINYTEVFNQLVVATIGNKPINYTNIFLDLITTVGNNEPIDYTILYQNLINATQNNEPIDYTIYWNSLINSINNQTTQLIPIDYSSLFNNLITATEGNKPINYTIYYQNLISSIQANAPINYTLLYQNLDNTISQNKPINYTTFLESMINSLDNLNISSSGGSSYPPINYTNLFQEISNNIANNQPFNYTSFMQSYQNSLININTNLEDSNQLINVEISTPYIWIADNTYTVYAKIKDKFGEAFTPQSISISLKDSSGKELFYTTTPFIEKPGIYRMQYDVPSDVKEGDYTIVVQISDGTIISNAVKNIQVYLERPSSTLKKLSDSIIGFIDYLWSFIENFFDSF